MNYKKFINIILSIIFIGIFFFTLSDFNLNNFLEFQHKISPGTWVIIFFLFFLSYLAKALRFWLTTDLRFIKVLYATIYQNFFLFLLPFRLGELSYVKKLKDYNINWKNSLKNLIVVRLYDILVLAILALIVIYLSGMAENYLYLAIFFILSSIFLILFFGKRFEEPRIKNKKISLFFSSILIWVVSFTPWIIILSSIFNINLFKIYLVISITLISSLIPINPPAGAGLINGAWTIGLILVGLERVVSINFGIFAYGVYVTQITLIFFISKIFEIYLRRK